MIIVLLFWNNILTFYEENKDIFNLIDMCTNYYSSL